MSEGKAPAAAADEAVLAAMGYKQEFKRRFSPLAVCGIAYSIIGGWRVKAKLSPAAHTLTP